MNALRLLGAIVGAAIGCIYLFVAYGFIGWGWSDSNGGWSPLTWILTLILWSLPFLFTFCFVYKCLHSNLKHALLTEVCTFICVVLLFSAYAYYIRQSYVLLEKQPPLVDMPQSNYRPSLPLSYPAIGIEANDGKFIPIMFLGGQAPLFGFSNPFVIDLQSEPARQIKVYRGTNETASENFFLGQFRVMGQPSKKQALELQILIDLHVNQELTIRAQHWKETWTKEIKLERVATNQK